MKGFEVNKTPITIVNLGGQFFALSDICTHEHCLVSGGFIDAGNIVCPCHGSQFDAKTGSVKNLPATEPLKTYGVKVEKGEIFVKV